MPSSKMLLTLANALAITATGAGTPVLLHVTPFEGGQHKNALLILNAAIAGGGVISIDGNPNAGPTAPVTADPNWASIVVLNAASPLEQEIELPLWIRVNVTTAGTGTVTLQLEGIQ
jgi:hypothetical protein